LGWTTQKKKTIRLWGPVSSMWWGVEEGGVGKPTCGRRQMKERTTVAPFTAENRGDTQKKTPMRTIGFVGGTGGVFGLNKFGGKMLRWKGKDRQGRRECGSGGRYSALKKFSSGWFGGKSVEGKRSPREGFVRGWGEPGQAGTNFKIKKARGEDGAF